METRPRPAATVNINEAATSGLTKPAFSWKVPTALDVPSALRLRAFGASLSVTSIVGASTTALRAFAHGDIAKHGRYFKPSSRRLFEAIDQTSKPSQSVHASKEMPIPMGSAIGA